MREEDCRHFASVRSDAEIEERRQLLLAIEEANASAGPDGACGAHRSPAPRIAVRAPEVLNEAPDYPQPVSFSRGLRIEITSPATHVFLSGTASVGTVGETLYPGDFRAQCYRTYRNLTRLLIAAGATWHDVVRCTCYLRDIERDYATFNEVRTDVFEALRLDPLPASTAIQARICRSDLLVEIEAHAIIGTSR